MIDIPAPRDSPTDSMRLSPNLSEVRRARHFVAERCQAANIDADAADAAILLTSEAVTNAFIHGRSEARLSFSLLAGVIHIEVGDENARHPRMVEDVQEALDGRGLHLIEALASHWGVRDEAPMGKSVWFEVPTAT